LHGVLGVPGVLGGRSVYTCFNTDRRSESMTTGVKVEQTVQEWGNGLGVRITAPVARAARFARGLPVTVEVVAEGILVRPAATRPRLTLAQKLRAFDPARHGGEAMADARTGAEVF
jgi:antitoxin MazE